MGNNLGEKMRRGARTKILDEYSGSLPEEQKSKCVYYRKDLCRSHDRCVHMLPSAYGLTCKSGGIDIVYKEYPKSSQGR